MAVDGHASSYNAARDVRSGLGEALRALFGEARRRQRRRRLRYALLALAIAIACSAAVAISVTVTRDGDGGGRSPTGAGRVAPAARLLASARDLSGFGQAPSLAIVGGRLLISDTDAQSFSAGRVTGTCVTAVVNPVSLRLGDIMHGSCGNPALFHMRVLAFSYDDIGPRGDHGAPYMLHDDRTLFETVRVATVDPRAPGGYRLGRNLVTYWPGADDHAEWIYGPSSLWIYAPSPRPGAELRDGELLQVSEATGRVLQRWSLPSLAKPLLAVDDDGLWLAPSNESGWPPRATPAQRVRYESLYHVIPGMRTAEPVLHLGPNSGAFWMVAFDHTVWLDASAAPGPSRIWRLTGPTATASLRGREIPGGPACGGAIFGGQISGSSATGVYCVNYGAYYQSVTRLSPRTGAPAASVKIAMRTQWVFPDNSVTFDGSYYVLDPPGPAVSPPNFGAAGTPATIYRIRESVS